MAIKRRKKKSSSRLKRTQGYLVVAINERTGRRVLLTTRAMSHEDACTVMSKFSPHRGVRIQLQEKDD